MVVTIHDVSFAAHPEWFAAEKGFRRRLDDAAWPRDARARVLTVSDFSKREIVRCFGIDPAKIEVIYSGVTDARGRRVRRAALTTRGHVRTPPPRIRSVLFVGSIFARRHVPELIEGFARWRAGGRT